MKINKTASSKVGKTFEELTEAEMNNVQGSGLWFVFFGISFSFSWSGSSSSSSSSSSNNYSTNCSYNCVSTGCTQ